MLFCFSLLALLLYETVLASVCSQVYNTSPGIISAKSQNYQKSGCDQYTNFINAPRDSYISVNLTSIFGFGAEGTRKPDTARCMPKVEIRELLESSGKEKNMDTICKEKTRHVFHSTEHILKLTYRWVPDKHSGFQLAFDFHKKKKGCEAQCADGSCLPASSLVCNNTPDCSDNSDEENCPTGKPTRQVSNDARINVTQIVVIVVVVAFSIAVISCAIGHYRISLHSWREQRERGHSVDQAERLSEHSQLAQTARHAEVIYVPGPTQEHQYDREVALQRERRIRLQAIRTDMDLNLPPAIAISEDGEEGYAHSQRLLHLSTCDPHNDLDRESVRPPPNRTIFDSESPPPYRSHSLGLLERPPSGLQSSYQRRQCNGSPMGGRCYHVTNNNYSPHYSTNWDSMHSATSGLEPGLCAPGVGRTYTVMPPGGHARSHNQASQQAGDLHLGPPPDYSDVIANTDVYRTRYVDNDV